MRACGGAGVPTGKMQGKGAGALVRVMGKMHAEN